MSLRKNNSTATPSETGPERTWSDPVPGRLAQRSVQACERGAWSLYTWPKDGGAEPGEATVRPFVCKSYRCRRCGPWVARQDLARITAGATSRPWWLYVVLTVDPKDWASSWSAYKGVGELWDHRLRRRFERAFGRVEYLQTWERHLGGAKLPHLNLLITGTGLREAVMREGVEWRYDERSGHGHGRSSLFPFWRPWLAGDDGAAKSAGFGSRVWCEVVQESTGLAWYLTKAAHDLGAARMKDGDQTPIGAPPGFRRFRASRGLLPARPRGGELWTGAIGAKPLHEHADPTTGDLVLEPEDVDVALEARKAAQAWRAAHPNPVPRYERAHLVRVEVEGSTGYNP